VRFERGDVLGALRAWAVRGPEHVVLDPPRTGAGPGVVAALVARRPASIVYVSCDPPTLARDLAALAAAGYGVTAVRALDMFPDTFHMETVVRLVPG
jgi:tRNA/tmRNA/rRNA uracil-C5-methylase (TrmA/RlmC/RlmD family)